MNHQNPSVLKSVCTILALSTIAIGCGKENSIVRGVNVETRDVQGDAHVAFQAQLESGAMSFPVFDIPIHNPDNQAETWGRIALYDVLPSGSQLEVELNVTLAGQNPTVDRTLPNGNNLPITGIDDAVVVKVPVSSNGTAVYGAFAQDVALLGAAIPISEFDRLGNAICPATAMPAFNLGNGVRGIAGVFTGCNAGESGIGIFIDAGRFGQNDNQLQLALSDISHSVMDSTHLDFDYDAADGLSSKEAYKIKRGLYKMNKKFKNKRLHLK